MAGPLASTAFDIRTWRFGLAEFRKVALAACAALCLAAAAGLSAQTPEPATPLPPVSPPGAPEEPSGDAGRPLPALPALMRAVIARQRASEAAEKDYIYREDTVIERLGNQGEVKQTETYQQDVFWLDGVEVRKMIRRNGKDLTPDEAAKESARIDRQVARARKRREKKDADAADAEEELREQTRLSKMLEAGSFAHERRELVDGRETILADFVGDPHAKSSLAIRDMDGTIAIDEEDQALDGMQGEFVNDFKIFGGLAVKIDKGTRFTLRHVKVNGEVWLPADLMLEGQARVLLLLNGHVRVHVQDTDYRKFKASSTILPGYTPVEPAPRSPPNAATPQPAPPGSSPPPQK